MLVKELIEQLKHQDPNAMVVFDHKSKITHYNDILHIKFVDFTEITPSDEFFIPGLHEDDDCIEAVALSG